MKGLAFLLCLFIGLTGCSLIDTIPSPKVKYTDQIREDSRSNNWTLTAFRTFCALKTSAVLCSGNTFSPNKDLSFSTIYAVDVQLRGRFIYNTDWSLYHVVDLWQNWVISGDCEDYALTLSELLSDYGQPGADMRLVLLKVKTPFGDVGHAMLAVKSEDGGWLIIGVNPEERPLKEDGNAFILPDKSYIPMVEIKMDGSQKVIPFPGFLVSHDVIIDG